MKNRKDSLLKPALILITFLIIALINQSCEALSDSKVCTTEFRYIMVKVVDEHENPVHFNNISVTNYRTGDAIDLCTPDSLSCNGDEVFGNPELGNYTIYHDGLRGNIGFRPLSVLFEASNDSVSVQEHFLIRDDGCHVHKLSGPDVITAEG